MNKFILNNIILENKLINQKNEYYAINNDRKKVYKINETIYIILNEFSNEGKSIDDVKRNIFKDIDNKNKEVFEKFDILIENIIKSKLIILNNDKLNTNKLSNANIFFNIDKLKEHKIIEKIHDSSKSLVYKTEFNNNQFIIKTLKNNSKKNIKGLQNDFTFLNILHQINISPKPEKLDLNNFLIITHFNENYQNLKNFVNKNELSFQSKLSIINNILKIYNNLYDLKIFHNDIHYTNIIINNEFNVLLIDFEYSYKHFENPNYKVGVNEFLPPERISKNSFNKIISLNNKKSEVYQVTLLIYFILFNKLPFENYTTWSELYTQKLNWSITEEKILQTSFIDKRKSIFNFLEKGLTFKLQDRYNSIEELNFAWTNLINN